MQGVLLAEEALDLTLKYFAFETVLDIGSGEGLHAARFRAAGKTVLCLDASDQWGHADIKARFEDFDPTRTFDLVWASHVLEHQLNVNQFLRKVFAHLNPDGVFAITVPPMKPNIVGGHVSVWNEGLLLYNLILAGFDCSQVSVKRYGYNISVIGKRREAVLPHDLTFDRGDLEKLACFFPTPVHQDFDGNLPTMNWPPPSARVAEGQAC